MRGLQVLTYGVAGIGIGLIVAACWVAVVDGPLLVSMPLLAASMASLVAFAFVANRAWPAKPQVLAWPFSNPETRRAYALGTVNGIGGGLIFGATAVNFSADLGNNGKLVQAALAFVAAACFIVVWRKMRRPRATSVGGAA